MDGEENGFAVWSGIQFRVNPPDRGAREKKRISYCYDGELREEDRGRKIPLWTLTGQPRFRKKELLSECTGKTGE
jgi:hypothetical protein